MNDLVEDNPQVDVFTLSPNLRAKWRDAKARPRHSHDIQTLTASAHTLTQPNRRCDDATNNRRRRGFFSSLL